MKQPLAMCNRTDRVTISIFSRLRLSEFRFEANVTLTLSPRNFVHYFTLAKVSNLSPLKSSEFWMYEDAIV